MNLMKKSVILDLDLTSNEKDFSKYWIKQLKEKSSTLWFPTETAFQEQALNLSNGLSLPTGEASHHLIKRMQAPALTTTTLSHLSHPSVIVTTEKEVLKTKKIRIYPKNKAKWISLLYLSRYAYNATVAYKRDEVCVLSRQMQRLSITKTAQGWDNYVNHVIQESVRKAEISNSAVIRKRIKGEKSELHFKTKFDTRQGFDIQRFSNTGTIYPRYLGKDGFTITEPIPEYAKGRSARVIREYDEWYLLVQDKQVLEETKISKDAAVVALDPGVRTFLTTFSPSDVASIGEDFFSSTVMPLLLRLDQLISKRSKLKKLQKDYLSNPQWLRDKHRYFEKRINKIKARTKHLIEDLHNKAAQYLTDLYDIILLPSFDTSEMVEKISRKISSKTVRSMLGLKHFAFKQRLEWICQKKGKVLIEVNEAYTSKANPFTGKLMRIGSKRSFKIGKEVYNRDVNGARNIFIKNLIGEIHPFHTNVVNVAE